MNEIEDAHLVADAQSGNRKALDLLCNKYKDRFYHFISKHLSQGDEDTANEIFQESWERAIRKLESFEGESNFLTWIIGFAKTYQYEIFRKMRKRKEISLEQMTKMDDEGKKMSFEPMSPVPGPADEAIKNEESLRVRKAIRELPDIYRIPIHQQYLWDLDINQIVENINKNKKDSDKVNVNTIKKRLERAKKMLKDVLEGEKS